MHVYCGTVSKWYCSTKEPNMPRQYTLQIVDQIHRHRNMKSQPPQLQLSLN